MSTDPRVSEEIKSGADMSTLRPLSETELSDQVIWGVLDAAPDGIVIVDRDGRILFVNVETERLFGYERTHLLGRAVEDLLPERLQRVHRAHRTRYNAEPRTRLMGRSSR